MLYPSPRYGAEALIKLIEAAGAKTMLTPETPLPVVTEILQKKEMKQYQIPSLEQCFAKKAEKYPFTKTFEECKDEALLCLRMSAPSFLEHTFCSPLQPTRTIRLTITNRHVGHNRLPETNTVYTRLGQQFFT